MIVVLTDPRRTAHLLATLASIDSSASSGADKVVLVDGVGAPSGVPPSWRVILAPKPFGATSRQNKWTAWAAFDLAVAAGQDLLFFEDDVLGSPSAALYAETLPVPTDCAIVSLYAPWGDLSFPPGIWRRHAAQFLFCQALKVPLWACQVLAAARPEMAGSTMGGSDECIAEIAGRRGWLVGYHYPGLFQHVGDVSLVSEDRTLMGSRSSRAWLSDVDAMRLRRAPGDDLGGGDPFR